ncbi:MAG: class I SAM-dependent methyltransferase [Rhodospirillales bacterium]|nr:class I SAM-dependent methyltransferase [Rhodospirillales bacterium]
MSRPADEVFEDSLLASLYDHFNGWDACDDFYFSLARTLKSGAHVLDLGCGTGLLACRIAAEGYAVTGVDPAEGMLGVARARAGGERVAWIKSAGQMMRLPQRFALIYMTGHAFQALLTDDDAVAVLRTAGDHLAADGLLAFETRNPARKAWLSWTPDGRRSADTADHGEVQEFFEARADPNTGVVDLAAHYRFADTGRTIVGRSRIRFIDLDHLERLLAAAGLAPAAWYGDWDRSPLTGTSREFIVVARPS